MKTTKTPDHNPTGRTRPKRKMGTVLRAKLSKYRARVSQIHRNRNAPSRLRTWEMDQPGAA